MEYKDLFSRYGRYSDYVTHTINISVQDPATIKSGAEIASRDKWVAESIKELESYLQALRQYRQELAKRYGELETMPYKLLLKAGRRRDYENHVHYNIWIYKLFEDGTRQETQHEHFYGIDRRKALARIEELRKKNPGIQEELNLEKSPWER